MATAVPPAAVIAAAVSPIVPGSGEPPGSTVRAATATAAPSAPNRAAMAAPIPRLAPVTMATFPSSTPMAVPSWSPRSRGTARGTAEPRPPIPNQRLEPYSNNAIWP